MPNRMLRDWTLSEKVNTLSVHSERFFTRLIMKVDDHGCFFADTRVLKSYLFPLLSDSIREADLLRWMTECQKAGLIVLYENTGKRYLQINDFRQRLDKARSKYPLPIVNDPVTFVNDLPGELEEKQKLEAEGKQESSHLLQNSNLFRKPVIPTMPQVEERFISNGGTKEMAERFFNKHNSVDWYLNGSPITNFNNLVPGFISSWIRNSKNSIADASEPVKIKLK